MATDKQERSLLQELGLASRKTEFIERVLKYIHGDGLTAIDAMLEVCKEMGFDPEDVGPLVKGPLMEKVRVEAIDRNILRNIQKPTKNSIISDCL
ncbi:MAG: hypothetical protein D4Q77_00445 [Methanothrix sp.]|nr:MAG: hypothetical protein D4Q77_00445 [Methanothrix sp.]